jgi:hypothetical protein
LPSAAVVTLSTRTDSQAPLHRRKSSIPPQQQQVLGVVVRLEVTTYGSSAFGVEPSATPLQVDAGIRCDVEYEPAAQGATRTIVREPLRRNRREASETAAESPLDTDTSVRVLQVLFEADLRIEGGAIGKDLETRVSIKHARMSCVELQPVVIARMRSHYGQLAPGIVARVDIAPRESEQSV